MKPAFSLRHALRSALCFALCFVLGAPAARAQETTTMGLDCWIAVLDTYYQAHSIFCIRDRSGVPTTDPALGEVNELALDEIHYLFHNGSRDELEQFVAANAALLLPGDMWRIRILDYPVEYSWEEERPQMLAETICPETYSCPVLFRRW